MIAQIGIAAFGVAAIWLSQDPDVSRRRWASVLGLIAQPFWFYETAAAAQWGIFGLTFLYTWAWAKGFYHHWLESNLAWWRLLARVKAWASSL